MIGCTFNKLSRTLNINSTLIYLLFLPGNRQTKENYQISGASWLCSQHALLPQVVTQVMGCHRWLCCGWESPANRASGPGHKKHDWSRLGRGDGPVWVVRPSTAVRGDRRTWPALTHTGTQTQRWADGLYVQMYSTSVTYGIIYSGSQNITPGFSLVFCRSTA